MTPLRWLMELQDVIPNDIMHNLSKKLIYSTILIVNSVIDKMMLLEL